MIMLALLAERLRYICTTGPALNELPLSGKRQVLIHGLRCFSSLVNFEKAVQRLYDECFAVANGTTPLVDVIIRKRVQSVQKTAAHLSADLVQIDLFFPPYPNPSLLYTMDTEEATCPSVIGVDLWLATCPYLVVYPPRAPACICYGTDIPTIQHLATLPDLFHLFEDDAISLQTRRWGAVKKHAVDTGIGEIQQAIRQQLAHTCLYLARPAELFVALRGMADALQDVQHGRHLFAALLQQHCALGSILQEVIASG